jgi:hypothetical protein
MEKITQILLITSFLSYLLNILKYIRNPINYSSKELVFITHNNLNFCLEILIIICFTIYIKNLLHQIIISKNVNPNFIFLIPIVNILILIYYKRNPILDKTKFFLPPKNISSSINIILILNIICISTLLYYTKSRYLLPILFTNIYFLSNNYNFYACKFDLPSTFNKK